LTDQNIPSEKSEALDSPAMLVHVKVIWLIRTSLLRDQRHWTHLLWRWFDWSEHSFWEIRGTGLTRYVGPCKGDLTDQNIPSEKSEALDSPTMLVQRWFDWSEHPFWEIRGTGLTAYVGPYKDDLTDQNIPSEKSEALDSPPMFVHAKVIWLIRTSLLRNQRHWTLTTYVCSCKGDLTNQNIPSEKSEALDSPAILVHAKVIWLIRTSLLRNQSHWTHLLWRWFDWSEHSFWEIKGTGLTRYVGAKVIWLIRTSLLRNQSHWTHLLWRWFDWSEHSFWEIKGTGLTRYVGAKVIWLIRTSLLRNQRHWTHLLWRWFDWSEYPFWKFRDTGLTCYIEID